MKKSKAEDLAFKSWEEGFVAGVGVGMIDATAILRKQKEAHGNLAGIDDLIDLISGQIISTQKEYKEG